MDLSATLSMRGKTANEMKRTADGEVSLRGENLTVTGVDLDRTFSRYEATPKLQPRRRGRLLHRRPVRPAGHEGIQLREPLPGIRRQQQDPGARLPLEGGTWHRAGEGRGDGDEREPDRAHRKSRFRQRTVRRCHPWRWSTGRDAPRCARRSAALSGNRRWRRCNVFQSVAGPVLKLFKQARNLLGGKCEVVYAGSVAPPK